MGVADAAAATDTPPANADAGPSTSPDAKREPDAAERARDSASATPADAAPRERKRRLGVDPSLILSEGRSKRRRTPTPEPAPKDDEVDDPRDRARAKALGTQIYDRIMHMTDSTGESMSEPFVKLPNKFADYYETIKHPMSLEMVHEKLEGEAYETLRDVCADLGQIWNNAKRYNVRESLIFQYAKKYHKVTRQFYSRQTAMGGPQSTPAADADDAEGDADDDADGEPDEPVAPAPRASRSAEAAGGDLDAEGEDAGTPDGADGDAGRHSGRKRGHYMKDGPTVYKLLKPVLKVIKELKADERLASAMFAALPDSRQFPDYYKAIAHPISLSEIEARMVARRYDTTDQFFADINLMCANAMLYNEDGSDVYRDAEQIKEVADVHHRQIRDGVAQPFLRRQKVTGQAATTPTPSRSLPPTPASAMAPSYGAPGGSAVYPYAAGGPSAPHAPHPSAVPYLPQLPPGVVTEEVVASLERYPAYEQQAWAASLPPLAQVVYRQMQAASDAKKRGGGVGAPPTPGPGAAAAPSPLGPHASLNVPGGRDDRAPPPKPTITHIDFAFPLSLEPPAATASLTPTMPTQIRHAADEPPPTPPPPSVPAASNGGGSVAGGAPATGRHRTESIRIRNLRGVVHHAVAINGATSDLALTAYIDPSLPRRAGASAAAVAREGTPPATDVVPEVAIRINGTPGSLPKIVYGDRPDRPRAARWHVYVPPGRMESKIEIVATRPGQLAETSAIYVIRQF